MPTTFTTGTARGKLPLLGHMWPLMRAPIDFIASNSNRGDLIEIWLGPTRAYLPCHPDLIRQVLPDDPTFHNAGPFFEPAPATPGTRPVTRPYPDPPPPPPPTP